MSGQSTTVSDRERQFLAHQRVGYLATADRRAIPHVVPICFVISENTLYITIDQKPKGRNLSQLKRYGTLPRTRWLLSL